MLRLICSLLLLVRCLHQVHAQDQPYFPYYSKDTAQVYQLAVLHRNAIKAHFVVPKSGNKEYREHYQEVVQQTSNDVYNAIRYSALLDAELEPYAQQVFSRILKANPSLPSTAKLVLTKNPEPNAYAVGNGTVILNVGLLPRLENESQLAFILCHELAHVKCQHMESGIREQLTALHSHELKREFRRIINSQYNISSKIKALALGFSLNNNSHSRRYEKQADSLGYVLLTHTSYDAPQAYRALQLLDTIDEPEITGSVPLPTYFSCSNFPRSFGVAPAKSQSIFTVKTPQKTALEATDTLKSHPDCAKRMRFMETLAQGHVAQGPQIAATLAYNRIRHISRLEVIQSWFDYDCYDHALFEALQLLPQQPQNTYLRSVVVLSLYALRQHLQNHTYYEVVANISQQNPASFNELLRVLHDLHFDDFKGLSSCFVQTTGLEASTPSNEYDLAACYATRALAAETTSVLKTQYQKQYAGGKFEKLLFSTSSLKTTTSSR